MEQHRCIWKEGILKTVMSSFEYMIFFVRELVEIDYIFRKVPCWTLQYVLNLLTEVVGQWLQLYARVAIQYIVCQHSNGNKFSLIASNETTAASCPNVILSLLASFFFKCC